MLPPTDEVKEEVRFVLDVKNLASKFAPCVPKPNKKGKLMLSPEKIKMIRRQIVATQTQEKELRSEYPQLEVFPDELMVRLSGTDLELNPSSTEIEKDVSLFLKYMDGYEKFHGDVTGMKKRYFEFANWFFCTPFMACMRDMAVRYNQKSASLTCVRTDIWAEQSRKDRFWGNTAENDDWSENEDLRA